VSGFSRDAFVVGEDGILLADGGSFREERAVAGVGLAGGLALPLEVADPEDELGDGDGVRGDFEAEELLGAHAVFLHLEGGVAAEGGGEFEDFGFEALEVLERDIEEIRGAAGGVENAEGAEAAVKIGDELQGLGVLFLRLGAELVGGGSGVLRGGGVSAGEELAGLVLLGLGGIEGGLGLAVEIRSGEAGGFPFLAQGLDNGGADEALDIRSGACIPRRACGARVDQGRG
jgi:hypothetical protein